jgi:hypothetical protein
MEDNKATSGETPITETKETPVVPAPDPSPVAVKAFEINFGCQRRADITPDKQHRYSATRLFEFNKPIALFIGLQPLSDKDFVDDAVILKAVELAKQWGYGAVHVVNVFSTLKKLSKTNKQLVGPRNMETIYALGKQSRLVIFCWGDNENLTGNTEEILKHFPAGRCLGKTESGNPVPLFDVQADAVLEQFQSF